MFEVSLWVRLLFEMGRSALVGGGQHVQDSVHMLTNLRTFINLDVLKLKNRRYGADVDA